jgi:hypothetical protein
VVQQAGKVLGLALRRGRVFDADLGDEHRAGTGPTPEWLREWVSA